MVYGQRHILTALAIVRILSHDYATISAFTPLLPSFAVVACVCHNVVRSAELDLNSHPTHDKPVV